MREFIFADRDGIEWCVSWQAAEHTAVAVGGREVTLPAGLQFECTALIIRVPMQYWIDPRAVPRGRLQAMIDREMAR